jgi:hypothetical protein
MVESTIRNHLLSIIEALVILQCLTRVHSFTAWSSSSYRVGFWIPSSSPRSQSLFMALPIGKNYVPKWKKKATLAEELGKPVTASEVGLKGTVPVTFKMGNETRSTMASPGDPIRFVANQAGQFILYGCGKGECGTCEAMCNGKWIRPCVATVPNDVAGDLVIVVKSVKSKRVSSGKFFTARSFVMGFWNNLLGMIGFVRDRRAARKNWNERREYEDLIAKRTLEKKMARQRIDPSQVDGTKG